MSNNSHTTSAFSKDIVFFALRLLRNDCCNVNEMNDALQNSLVDFIHHHGLTTYFYTRADRSQGQLLLRQSLKKHYFAVSLRNTQLFETFKTLSDLLVLNDIEYIPLKGAFLLPIIYKDIAGRAMADIDVLIHPKDYPKCSKLLLKLGATQENEFQSDFLEALGHQYPPFWLFNTSIEIHSRIFAANLRYNIPVEDVWNNLEIFSADGSDWKGINIYLLICYLAIHIHYSEMRGEYKLYWYLDVFKVLESCDDFDITKLDKWFLKYGVEKPVISVLQKVAFLFGLSIDGLKTIPERSKTVFLLNISCEKTGNSKGYSVAIERVLYTKGIFKKWLFIFHTIKFGVDKSENSAIVVRIIKIANRFLSYMFKSIFTFKKK